AEKGATAPCPGHVVPSHRGSDRCSPPGPIRVGRASPRQNYRLELSLRGSKRESRCFSPPQTRLAAIALRGITQKYLACAIQEHPMPPRRAVVHTGIAASPPSP